jgi:DNA repair photolyase
MTVIETQAKSILRKHKKIDSWFLSHYGMNLYRGCSHNCIYCDGRSENYYVEGEFGEDVTVKVNAIDILKKELDPARRRIPLKRSYIMLGGGVGDSYQPIEEKFLLSRNTLQLIHKFGFPVHILTKSILIKRDIDLITMIHEKTRAIVSMSFSSVDDRISAIFEPGVPPPSKRLRTLAFFKSHEIPCGMFLLPVIPFITDTPESIKLTIKKAKNAGVDFIIFGCMTLKTGRQKNYFLKTLTQFDSKLINKYNDLYRMNRWGEAAGDYYQKINKIFYRLANQYKIPQRIPFVLFNNILNENDLVVVILEHIDYLLKMKERTTPFGYAAYSISQLKEPLSNHKENLTKIKGVGPMTERIIKEILETGRSTYYEKLSTY